MMKIFKWVCGILLLLLGADLVFVGAAGSWESLTSGQLVDLVLMLPMGLCGVGLIWLGVRLFRGCPGKEVQEHVPSKQEKAAQEEARKKAAREAQERKRQEEEHWLEEHPALKAQFDYLHTMLSREVLSFYDPSGKEYGSMDSRRNHTGGEWMRTAQGQQ